MKISFPFESKNIGTEIDPEWDRGISSDHERLFNRMRYTNGVFNSVGESLKVTANNNMTITVGTGGMNIEGAMFYMDTPQDMQLEPANPTLSRIDRVVGRFDTALSVRSIDLYVKTGVPGTAPVAPALSEEPNYFELALADIYINKGTTTVTPAHVKDQRMNNNLCGFVLPAMPQSINTSDLWSQYEASLNEWYETVASALDGTTAGRLQNQIDAGSGRMNKIENRLTAEENKIQDEDHGGTGSKNREEYAEKLGLVPVPVSVERNSTAAGSDTYIDCYYLPRSGKCYFDATIPPRKNKKDYPADTATRLFTVPAEYAPVSSAALAVNAGGSTPLTGYISASSSSLGEIRVTPKGKALTDGWIVMLSGSWKVRRI